MKKHQINYQTGLCGELTAADLFSLAYRVNKRSYDLKIPTMENPRGNCGKVEVKSAKPSVTNNHHGWQFKKLTWNQKSRSDFLIWIVFDGDWKVKRIYFFDKYHYPQTKVFLDSLSEARWAPWRLV